MKSMILDASVKNYFFDRAKVLDSMHKKNNKRLSRIGAFVRTRSKSSLRRRQSVSMPGQTPSVRSRDSFATFKNILFAASRDFESVIIGPRGIPRLRLKRSTRQTSPELAELGGTSRITMTEIDGKWLPGLRSESAPTKEVTANYEPRPFMGPALAAESKAGTLAGVFSHYPMG